MCPGGSAILCAELKSRAHKAARAWLQHSPRKCKKRGLISGAAGRICGLLWARERGGAARPQADGFPCGPSPQGEKVWEARAKDRGPPLCGNFSPPGSGAGVHAGGQGQLSGQVKAAPGAAPHGGYPLPLIWATRSATRVQELSAGVHAGGQHQRSSQVKATPGAAPP